MPLAVPLWLCWKACLPADNIHWWIEEQRSRARCQSNSSLIVWREEKNECLREGGPHMLNVKSNYRTNKRCAQLCQVFIFSRRVAAEAYER